MELDANEVFMTLLLSFKYDSVRLSTELVIDLDVLRLESNFLKLSGGFLGEAQIKDG